MSLPVPEVGVGLLLLKGNQVLLGKRIIAGGGNGHGEYAGAGGRLELMESFEDAVVRELAEEAGPGIKVKNLRFQCVFNMTKYAPKHYVGIAMVAEWESGEPVVMEPHKLESWGWYDLDNLPSPIYEAVRIQLDALDTGEVCVEHR